MPTHEETWAAIRAILAEMSARMREARSRAASIKRRDLNPAERGKQLRDNERELAQLLRDDRRRIDRIVREEVAHANRPGTVAVPSEADYEQLQYRRVNIVERIRNAPAGSVGRVYEEEIASAPEQYRPHLSALALDEVKRRGEPEAMRAFGAVRGKWITDREAQGIARRAAAAHMVEAVSRLGSQMPAEVGRALNTDERLRYFELWSKSTQDRSVAAGVEAVERAQKTDMAERTNAVPARAPANAGSGDGE